MSFVFMTLQCLQCSLLATVFTVVDTRDSIKRLAVETMLNAAVTDHTCTRAPRSHDSDACACDALHNMLAYGDAPH